MAQKVKISNTNIPVLDFIAALIALGYLWSVLTVAHHTSMWVHNGTGRIVEAPSRVALIASLILCGYSWYKNKRFSVPVVITLTTLATTSIFWLSGLRTNFYF